MIATPVRGAKDGPAHSGEIAGMKLLWLSPFLQGSEDRNMRAAPTAWLPKTMTQMSPAHWSLPPTRGQLKFQTQQRSKLCQCTAVNPAHGRQRRIRGSMSSSANNSKIEASLGCTRSYLKRINLKIIIVTTTICLPSQQVELHSV